MRLVDRAQRWLEWGQEQRKITRLRAYLLGANVTILTAYSFCLIPGI